MSDGWIVLGQGKRLRWGGDLRRHYLLAVLARATRAHVAGSWTHDALLATLDAAPAGRHRLTSVELLDPETLELAAARTTPTLVDLHDEPVGQHAALGHPLSPERTAAFQALVESNLAVFKYVAAPSLEFAQLARLDPHRTIIASNGTDTRLVVPGPWPRPCNVGMVSGASPGRGIETLIEACRRLRPEVPGLRLWLALVGTAASSLAYLDALRTSMATQTWITIETVPFRELSDWMARTSVLVIPHPAGHYFDSALPIKLFDYFAAGRPVVTTPRVTTADRVVRHRAGLVTDGDGPDDLAESIGRLLADSALARRMGMAGRAAAESTYDWRVIGRRLADDLLRREDKVRWIRSRALRAGRRAIGLRRLAKRGSSPAAAAMPAVEALPTLAADADSGEIRTGEGLRGQDGQRPL